jgi:hypothetical protein
MFLFALIREDSRFDFMCASLQTDSLFQSRFDKAQAAVPGGGSLFRLAPGTAL